ncbi:hypothetical protein M4D54_05550 [Brachybacterium sp. p3-SID1565]|uniref:DUF6541 family protein n=1 Tax=Brachybacterium sp. p3-SID1565 TaxID=2916046 RepID=UPI0021A31921|nr:DUF6541 family protein [Brachybacterium sp. p3-SID1565]MCT1385098.1 hypothetical protein [Brachybacterium sp. p3-SID1565]
MWTDVIPGVIVALVLLIAPGAAVLLCWRVHWPTALVAAPPVSLALVLLSGLLARLADSWWGVDWLVIATTLAVGVVALLRWATPWGRRIPRWSPLPALAAGQYLMGQTIAWLFMTPLFLTAFVEPTTIAQRYDNAFHLNAISAITRTGQATPFDTGALLRGSIYPNGWHSAAALVQQLSSLELQSAVHALTLVTMLVVWPWSIWLLVEVLARPGTLARLITGPLSLAFAGYPAVLLDWGLVYPTILGLAVAPAMAALFIHLALDPELLRSPVRTAGLIGLTGVGVGIAHPSAALSALIIALPIVAVALVRHLRASRIMARNPAGPTNAPEPGEGTGQGDGRNSSSLAGRLSATIRGVREMPGPAQLRAAVLAIVVVGSLILWAGLAPSTASAPWVPFQSTPQALGEAFLGGAIERYTLLVITLLSAAGLIGSAFGRGRDRLPLLAMLGPVIVYWASSAVLVAWWRDLLSGFMYRDSLRTAAMLTVTAVPLAIWGAQCTWDAAERLWASRRERKRTASLRSASGDGAEGRAGGGSRAASSEASAPRSRAVILTVAGVLVSTVLAWHVSSHPEVRQRYYTAAEAYRTWDGSEMLSPTEFEMLEDLPEHVPGDAYVISDPWEGGGLVYAFTGREVSRLYMTLSRTPAERYLDDNFKHIAFDPKICGTLPEDRPLYFLDLEELRIYDDDIEVSGFEGYEGITEHTPGFDLVHQVGDTYLYEVTAC